jgi:hypothetical protein
VDTGKAMSSRAASLLAWFACALALSLTALGLFLLLVNMSRPGVYVYDHWLEDTLFVMSSSIVGAVIISRSDPRNLVGWLFCITGLLWGAGFFVAEYAIRTLLAVPGSLPFGEAAAWIFSWLWVPNFGLLIFLVLLFPDGRLPTSGWRWFAWVSVLSVLAGAVLGAFSPGSIVALGPIHNPLGIEGLPNTYEPVQALMLALVLLATTSLFVRLRRTRGVEHHQIKWFAYTAATAASGAIVTYTLSTVVGARWLELAGFVVLTIGVVGVPISMGIAIMRYRLYDIDLVINRTLVYGSLTALLAAGYFGSILLLQGIGSLVFQVPFRTLTGQDTQLANVAATLAMAALFNPLRRRIQAFIDRRFYRRKYDARKTLEAFSATLRDETELDALSDDLVGVVRETMQPAHVSLWLRPDRGPITHHTPQPGGVRIPPRAQDAVRYQAAGEEQGAGSRLDSSARG